MRSLAVPLALLLTLIMSIGVVSAAGPSTPRKGAAGIGDPYFPTDGNGGYDVKHYGIALKYEPATDQLRGTATIKARATHALKRFNLDYDGPRISSVKVDGRTAKWKVKDGELIVTPARAIKHGRTFTIVVRYRGIPGPIEGAPFGGGWTNTDDGAFVAGQPHGATTWFPANDHPADKATVTVKVDVPRGVEAVSNGRLASRKHHGGRTTWTWVASKPMASYLVVLMIGQFDIRKYTADGIRYWDAVDPDLYAPVASPSTGTAFLLSQMADDSYKRLTRQIAVPAGGATLSFDVTYDTEFPWDFVFVEARTAGGSDWTTLPEINGLTTPDPWTCPYLLNVHPFLAHYQTVQPDETCTPTGTTGEWWAATGSSGGPQTWTVDLGAWASGTVEVSITYASDDVVQLNGVFIDDIVVSTGVGSTSFEADGDVMDGWTTPAAPAGSPGNANTWVVGGVADTPPPQGTIVDASLARQPEIIAAEVGWFGPYPWKESGGIVDDAQGVGFALETQTRPIYSRDFFTDSISGDAVVVHELAHQWFGDSVALKRWQHIWLNEGFATYAEWLWSEREGLGTAQENFDFWSSIFAPDDPFWQLPIGDPGPDGLFDFAVYVRGAMTVHALRTTVGDGAFFEILKTWTKKYAGGNVTTRQFIALAERISGQQLDDLFERYLFTPGNPALPAARSTAGAAMSIAALRDAPALSRSLIDRYGRAVFAGR